MKLFITGGCGFIGYNLIKYVASDVTEIVVYDNDSSKSQNEIGSFANVTVIHGDINDTKKLESSIGNSDAVVHLAAYGNVVDSTSDPVANFDNNVRGTFSLLNAVRASGVKKLIFASTGGAIMGNTNPPVNESSLPMPISPYGASKLCGEAYCRAYSACYEIEIIALRFANIIGPFSGHKKGVVNTFMKALISGDPILIYGDGSSSRDYLDVEDLCSAIWASIATPIPGFTPLHIASGKETNIRELVSLVCKTAGNDDHPVLFKDARRGEVDRNFAVSDAAFKLLGFKPKKSLEQSIGEIWRWINQ